MTRLPDPDRSRAILIGTGTHADGSGLPSLPAIGANLADLRQVLTDPATGSLPQEHCIIVSDPATAGEVGSLLARVAQEATDLLFVYYGGHGLVDDRGRLHLALPHTDAAHVRWTALPFETLREELLDSPAAIRVLVLDCCFSGRAIEAMTSGHSTVAGQIDVAGTYTLASTSANAVAYAPQGATHTAFTGALLTALRGPVALSLDDLFDEVRRDLATRDMPRPQRRVVNNAGRLILVRPPDPNAPRPALASDPPPTAWTDPGASVPPLPLWHQGSVTALPKPRRPKAKIRIPTWVWPLLIAAVAGLGGWYWLHTQTHWSKGDLKDAVQQAAAELGKDTRLADSPLEAYIGQLIDESGKGPPHGSTPSVEHVSRPDGDSNAGDYEVTSEGMAFCMHVTTAVKAPGHDLVPATVTFSVTVTDGSCPTANRPSAGNGSAPSSTPSKTR
ncbi:caspase family protein [Streptomyces cyanogenus]|uniref:Caspase domain protein n=1 Tax=Streptomyces cyanogenus TaxID=80860 RepID=A0ABX7TID3_STRCY|nr:caspase family protein [Streptomyces cyanogenus]QTD95991.1 Caspase domain protein [Streptomyces cyanogenus]